MHSLRGSACDNGVIRVPEFKYALQPLQSKHVHLDIKLIISPVEFTIFQVHYIYEIPSQSFQKLNYIYEKVVGFFRKKKKKKCILLGKELNIQYSFSHILLDLRSNISRVSILCLHLDHKKQEWCSAPTDIWKSPTDFNETRISSYISKYMTDTVIKICYKNCHHFNSQVSGICLFQYLTKLLLPEWFIFFLISEELKERELTSPNIRWAHFGQPHLRQSL